MTGPAVVRAMLNDHRVIAVHSSPLASRPWTAVDVAKGWTIACRDEDLTDKVELFSALEAGAWLPPQPDGQKNVVTGGKAAREQLQALADIMGIPTLPDLVDEFLAKIERSITATFDEDQWRVIGPDNDPYQGEAPEAWGYLVDTLDRYGYIDRVEQRVADTWRVRSMRDLLQAAGGDPL